MSAVFKFSYISSLYLTFCLLFVLALSAKNYDATLCHDDERQALLQFKSGLVDEADRLASWVGETSDCCKWAGILCDNITGHVHKIHLPGNCLIGLSIISTFKEQSKAIMQRLRGDISQSILYLKQLEHLDLSCNDFGGLQIPRFMGSLGNLRYLNLSRSGFRGTIPPQLGNLTELEVLCLGSFYDAYESTSITNMQWLSSMSSLRHLDMSGVYLTEASDWFQILDFAHNNLSGNIPRCFNNFTVLSKKETTEIDPVWVFIGFGSMEITNSASLVMKGQEYTYSTILGLVMVLDLSSNKFSGSIPVELMALQALQSLNISNNQLTGVIPKNIGDMKLLESFDVSSNHLSGELPMSLSGLSFLSSFNVSFNNLTGRIPSSTQLQGFNESSFFGNKLCGVPLTQICGEIEHHKDQQEGDTSHGVDFGLIISVLLGFFVGFWSIVIPLNVGTIWISLYKLRYMLGC
ncbi:putative endo-polygalacturonase [Helianthus annuus]|nr:putative endo-polygalacturonase [Helianthus annuus]